jgi:hypothetical protein
MHPSPYDQINKHGEYYDWDNPYYQAGFTAGCETGNYIEEAQREQIAENANLIGMQKELIAVRDERISELVSELNDLKQPWYVKLWKKVPRISINIERGA